MAPCPSSAHLRTSGARGVSHQVDNRCVRLVLLGWTRDADLHAITVNADDRGSAGIWDDEKIDLDAVNGFSNRIPIHGAER